MYRLGGVMSHVQPMKSQMFMNLLRNVILKTTNDVFHHSTAKSFSLQLKRAASLKNITTNYLQFINIYVSLYYNYHTYSRFTEEMNNGETSIRGRPDSDPLSLSQCESVILSAVATKPPLILSLSS